MAQVHPLGPLSSYLRKGPRAGGLRIALHLYWIGQPHRVRYLDEAYILSPQGVWQTTADDIADYFMADYYDGVMAYLA